jgi:hypothetical protein
MTHRSGESSAALWKEDGVLRQMRETARMAGEDPSDAAVDAPATSRSYGETDASVQMHPGVSDWLARRVDGAGHEVQLAVSVLPGRWLFRVESGASGSTIEHPTRHTCAPNDLAAAVRTWARNEGHAVRVEGTHAHEVRLSIVPAAPSRS